MYFSYTSGVATYNINIVPKPAALLKGFSKNESVKQ